MGKKKKPNKKDKKMIGKSKDASVKKKAIVDKLAKLAGEISTLKTKQKGLKEQRKAQQQEYTILAKQYQGIEKQTTGLLKHIPKLQAESRGIKNSLTGEIENRLKDRNRLDNLESGYGNDREQLSTLIQQMEQQVPLLDEIGNRLQAMEQLASRGEQQDQQIENLLAGNTALKSHIGTLVTELTVLRHNSNDFGSGIERLHSGLDDVIKGLQENTGQQQRMESSIENLDRAGSDVSLQMEQQHSKLHDLVEQAAKLDQTARSSADSLQTLRVRLRDLMGNQATTEQRLVNLDAELEKKSRYLDLEHQHLATRHTRLATTVLVVGILLLAASGIGYWVKFRPLEQKTTDSSQQIERISEQMKLQEGRLTNQEQHFSSPKAQEKDDQGLAPEEWDARFEQLNKNQDAMEANLFNLTEKQDIITAKLTRLEEDRDEMGTRLQQTDRLLSELVDKRTEAQTLAKQQEERALPSKNRKQGKQAQEKPSKATAAANNVRNSNWLQGLNPKHYTIQIIAAYDAALISRIAARRDLQKTVAIYKGEFNQRDWNILLYGDFSTLRAARSAIQDLPEDIRANSPWVRKLSTIQKDLAKG